MLPAFRSPEPASRTPISVLVTALDEEDVLPGALASVAGWAAEVIVVVDPRTVDSTREVARSAGAAVIEHPFESSSAQLAWGLGECANDWVLILDADERVDDRLAGEMERALREPHEPAYGMRRRNVAFGRALRFGDWGGDRVVRLVHRRQVSITGGMHWRVEAASVGRLAGSVDHFTLRSLERYVPKLRDYASRSAKGLVENGASAGAATAALRAAWRFLRAWVLRLGFLDGTPGFVVAVLAAYGTFLKWIMVWEASRNVRRS